MINVYVDNDNVSSNQTRIPNHLLDYAHMQNPPTVFADYPHWLSVPCWQGSLQTKSSSFPFVLKLRLMKFGLMQQQFDPEIEEQNFLINSTILAYYD